MNVREINGLGVKIYHEELENGLKILLIPFDDRKNYYIEYLTKYGAEVDQFKSNSSNKRIKTPFGVAHFLEHKMFEQENGIDPFSFYSKSGADANASTGYKTTSYTVEGVCNLEENLEFLIECVNSPYFTDKNVEKEKGIIIEELNMYKDQPENKLYETSNKAVFIKHPYRRDIGGTPKSVKKITKEILYECYNTFYQPNNMILAIAGNFDVEKTINLIKRNKIINSNKNNNQIKVYKIKEPLKVNKKEVKLNIKNLILPKFVLSFKSETELKSGIEKYKFSLCLDILLYILFGMSSQFRETMLEREMYSLLYSSSIVIENLFLVEFVAETKKPDDFKNEILNHLKNASFTKEDVERVKKVKISLEVMETDKPYRVLDMAIDQLNEYGEILYNKMDIIRNISYDDIIKVKDSINYDNYSYVVGYPKK